MIVEDHVLHVEVDAVRITAGGLAKLLGAISNAISHHFLGTRTGAQSISQLNRQQRPLFDTEIDRTELEQAKERLKRYAVDFAITKDEDNGKIHLWFKAQDTDRVQYALENVIIDKGKFAPEHSKVQEVCDRAKEAADVMNAMRTAAPPERGERV